RDGQGVGDSTGDLLPGRPRTERRSAASSRRSFYRLRSGGEPLEENAHSSFGGPLALVEAKDLVEKLGAAVEALPERERTVVTLYCYKELTLREVGEICDLSDGRICQIFYQAVAHLRALLTSPIRETG